MVQLVPRALAEHFLAELVRILGEASEPLVDAVRDDVGRLVAVIMNASIAPYEWGGRLLVLPMPPRSGVPQALIGMYSVYPGFSNRTFKTEEQQLSARALEDVRCHLQQSMVAPTIAADFNGVARETREALKPTQEGHLLAAWTSQRGVR